MVDARYYPDTKQGAERSTAERTLNPQLLVFKTVFWRHVIIIGTCLDIYTFFSRP